MGYTKETLKGVSWVGALRLSTRGVSFLRTLILARILSPVQFGIFGIAILVTALLEVFTETGVNVVLIQEKEELEKFINSAWIISILRGFLITLVMVIGAKFVSDFFHSPQSFPLLLLISIVPFLRGFINPSAVRFQKYLEFHKEFWYRSIILFVDAIVSISLAIVMRNAISLVFGMIAGVVVELFLSFYVITPRPTFAFQKEYISKVFHRGKWVTLGGIFDYLYKNLDNITVGRILGASSLGLYEVAYRISLLPITEISDVVSRVTFPVFSKITHDTARLKAAFTKTVITTSFLAIPFGLILFIFSDLIVRVLLGEKWIGVVPVLKILALFGTIRAISSSSYPLFLASGKQNYLTVSNLASIAGLGITIVPLVISYGIVGAGLSALIGTLISLPFIVFFVLRIFKTTQ